MRTLLESQGRDPDSIRDIVDVGAATGLSSLALLETFPGARGITALDLSPHFLAVGSYLQERRHQQQQVCGGGGDDQKCNQMNNLSSLLIIFFKHPK